MLSAELVQGLAPKVLMAAGAIVLYNVLAYLVRSAQYSKAISKFVFVNEKWGTADKQDFHLNAESIIENGKAMAKGRPFRMNDKSTQRLVLPAKFVDEIKNDERLDFHSFVSKEFFSSYPGFDGFSDKVDQKIFQDAVRIHLTQALSLTVEPLARETPNTLKLIYGDAPDWKECFLAPNLLKSVGRLTSLIFVGEDFMNDEEWQRISIMYTVDAFMAAKALNEWPAPLRPVVHWFLPECRKIRDEVKIAKSFIEPMVNERRAEMAQNGGKPRKKVLDSVDWFVAAAKGKPFDYASAQLSLAMASIHTTNNTLSFIMYDLLENPEYITLLREEIKTVFRASGKWEKNTLFNLKLMDSVLKESMRCHPHSLVSMPRVTKKEFTLSTGDVIPKDTYMFIGPLPHQDPANFSDPKKFNGHRFLKMREQPGHENKHQFVTTTTDMTVFGHGQHACPGRFFASNEIKLLLIHMLMYYDWKLPEGTTSVPAVKNGLGRSPNSRQKVLYKSRKPEVDVEGLVSSSD